MFRTLVFLFIFIPVNTLLSGNDITNCKWISGDSRTKIQFFSKDGFVYGKIVWMKEPNDKDGSLRKDKNNPDVSKRGNSILNSVFIWGLKYDGNKWIDGTLYVPQQGSTVDCEVYLNSKGELVIKAKKWGISKEKVWYKCE